MPTNGLKWGELPKHSSLIASESPRTAQGDSGLFGEETERALRVELFRRAVETGIYRVDSLTIADRLIEHGALDGHDDER